MGDVSAWWLVVAVVPGVVALGVCAALGVMLSRTRRDQRVLMPDGAQVPVVERQADIQQAHKRLEQAIVDLRSIVEDSGARTEDEFSGVLRMAGVVRFDAYEDMGGLQSWSVALLDGNRNGAVMTSLHSRDHARLYVKQVTAGVPAQPLSPEEAQAAGIADTG